ncbi:predicted protein [Naegleria gruberi]|uniref:Predicted protein n=1 Tax=Naegleria gruberi TaxID=5762 RepID=D2UYL9_NAEGR|nr:uncharacterized protein NAEGRDRAFT_61515 [Naegleria gruberi]EFC50495.1 predicted protein [Naegleria gruberi]|eukprot:XP_002683239.1 predicted protein [Naegleria gruberi strain NEG-M]
MEYLTVENKTIGSLMVKDCRNEFSCIDMYFDLWKVNQTGQCFYNPMRPSEFATKNTYNMDAFSAMYVFASFIILYCLLCVPSCTIFAYLKRNKSNGDQLTNIHPPITIVSTEPNVDYNV